MGKQGHKREKSTAVRDKMLSLSKQQLSSMSMDEIGALALSASPSHPLFLPILEEMKRRRQELLDNAPSPELREFAEEAFKKETFDQYLEETNQTEEFKRQAIESENEEVFEQIVNQVSERSGRMN